MEMAVNGDAAQRLRDFVGRGNRYIFAPSVSKIKNHLLSSLYQIRMHSSLVTIHFVNDMRICGGDG
jgi:hypothetical protein